MFYKKGVGFIIITVVYVLYEGCRVYYNNSTVYFIYICLFHTHMVYCYIMTNIIMNTHNNNNNKRYNKILKSADSISR